MVQPPACRELSADLGATVRRAAFSPDGRWFAVGGLTGLGVWNVGSEATPAITALPEYASPFFSPDNSELFAYNIERLGHWRLEGGADSPPQLKAMAAPKTDRVRSAQFTGKSLVLAANGGVLTYSPPDYARPEFVRMGSTHASVSSGGKWLVGTKDDSMWVYASRPWAWQCSIPVDSEILDHAFVPGDGELAIATASGLTFVDTRDWKTQRRLPAALDRRSRILFAPGGRSFWLTHDPRTAALYHTRTFALLLPLAPGVLPLAVSADGNQLLVSIDGRRLQLWDWAALRRQVEELGLGWDE